MESPLVPRHPLDHPGSIKILLGPEASELIAANADYHLAVITHPNRASPPEANGRLVLVCLRATKQQLDDAFRVITGTHRAVKTKKPATMPKGGLSAK